MSSDWINLFVHQGREFVESISRRDKDASNNSSQTLLNKSNESIAKHDNMDEEVDVSKSRGERESGRFGEGTSKDGKDMSSIAAKDIYEVQLEQLQEQLVDIMIQNQEMDTELKSLREGDVAKLSKELEKEQSKRRHLEEKLKKIKEENGTPKLRRRRRTDKSKSLLENDSEKETNGKDKTEINPNDKEKILGFEDIETSNGKKASRIKYVTSWVYSWYKALSDRATVVVWNIVSDMTDEETISDLEDADGPPLSVKTLKENIHRFGCGLQPLKEFSKKVNWVVSWKHPAATMLIFLAYLLSFWHGYTVPLMIFLAIVQLSANFIYSRFGSTSEKDDVESPADNSPGWKDRFQVVFNVARRVQNILGSLSDYLEKIKNLLMWKVPHITLKLYVLLWMLLITSLALDGPRFFTILGMLLGYKLFIQNPLYRRFPKLKKRHDTTWRLWNELPVDSESLAEGGTNELEESQVSISHQGHASSSSVSEVPTAYSKFFCERHKLNSDEILVKGWEEGWRTSLLNKHNPLIHMKHGRIYLTQNYLCFERSHTNMEKNILIKLSDIRCVKKYKPLFLMPGTGMSIEVCLKDKDEPYIFGAIYGRDEAYSDIIKTGREAGLPWAI